MATYSKDKGINVKTYSSDPPNASPSAWEGKLYYNSSDGQFKFQTLGVGAWASGNNLNSSYAQRGGAGIQTAAVTFGGQGSPSVSPRLRGETEKYDGTSWTESGDLNTDRRYVGGAGASSTAAIAYGGYTDDSVAVAETFNGSSWTEVGDMNTARQAFASCGASSTAALGFGGTNDPLGVNDRTEQWDGSSWTEITEFNTARRLFAAAGTTTSAIGFGGGPPDSALTEQWDGSSWTEIGDLNTARRDITGGGSSIPNALCIGGYTTANVANTESFDGTSWSEVADLGTARRELSCATVAPGLTSLAMAGYASDYSNASEEWNTTHTLKKVTTG